ncbi:MAG: ATP-binding cassette domain-containing protein, partial [Peptococcaceae bacterium]|nr:ATP-binding cassette domain-containing protein [Peptococcaceae bacterium]
MTALLETIGLGVNFSGFQAVEDVNMRINAGELRVIIGPNGAGKTTFMDLVTGKTKPTDGKILFKGADISGKSVHEIAVKYRIGRKFQGPNVFENMTVYENVEIALADFTSLWKTLLYRRTAQMKSKIRKILASIDLDAVRDVHALELSHGQRQWLEIGMVIAQSPELIILDEPTAGMTVEETYKTGEMIKALVGENTVIVVEHDMDF